MGEKTFSSCCVITQNSKLSGCHGDPGLVDSSAGVGPAVRPADSRHSHGAVDLHAAVAIATAEAGIQDLAGNEEPMNIKTARLETSR